MLNDAFQAPLAPLFVPGDRPERFAKAAASGADAVILDLEDAVAPAVRAAAREAVANHGIDGVPVIVRINATRTEDFQADLAALHEARFDALMLAKAEAAIDVRLVHYLLGRQVPLIALVETAGAFDDLACLLREPGVVQAAFGSLDLALDLGCQPSWEALAYFRGALVLQSRLAGLAPPLDGVTTSFDDPAAVRQDALTASGLGFGGKLAIHPRQVAPIREAFLPDAKAVDWAQAVLAAAQSGAAVQLDGAMVDRPLIERARRILSRSSVTGEKHP
ncbi:HpcH/HpaI aldolase/citrate lyase family protein [Pseudomonas aeruginosa]|uniref:HpcH/HpaI aldolase/citrate lyase family protein n=1 Tax=Pseudomonas aeruginosa TaxID=287 RepID=UPI0018DF58CD|nr:CoA ester lyase [Pseudomonas aeruginosa]QPZ62303.1 CoA ester lyase [Pseudomonas aeruginosa]HBO3954632.1 CoA ester lyase [Pseudomonas aeruginosa]